MASRWGSRVLHVWDRGFVGSRWLTLTFVHAVRFVLRWPKQYRLMDEQGRQRKAWEITRGERSMDHRLIWDARRRCQRKTGLVFVPVFDNTFQQPLTRWCAEVVTSRSMQADLLLINSISVLESRMRLTFHVRFEWGSMEK